MSQALIRLAPLVVLLSGFASALTVDIPAQSGTGTNAATPAVGGINTVSPVITSPVIGVTAPILQGGSAPAPQVNAVKTTPAPAPRPEARIPKTAPKLAAPRPTAPAATAVLGGAAQGIEKGRLVEAAGGSELSVRAALDRAFDASLDAGDVADKTGVKGRFQGVRAQVASVVSVANKAFPADAPGLYRSAIKTASDSLPTAAAAAVTKAVLAIAARKAEASLSDLVSAALTAAAAGQAGEAGRFVKGLDAWEALLGAPQSPLLANLKEVKTGVDRAVAAAVHNNGAQAAPRVWVAKRGASYVAVLPGSAPDKVPSGLASSFAFKLGSLAIPSLADAYRAFLSGSSPVGAAIYRARRARGDSVPAAAASVGGFWLKSMFMRAWNALLALLPGRGLPVVADAASLPRLQAAALSWCEAVELGAAAARQAASARTVAHARGAFALARRAAAAHEALTGASGAVGRIDALSNDFEYGVNQAALSPVDSLTPGLEALVSGAGGLRHWALRHGEDARAYAASSFFRIRGAQSVVSLGAGPGASAAAGLAASSNMRFVASGAGLWGAGVGPHGSARLSADLRATGNGGSLRVEVERGTEELARALDEFGFEVRRRGRALTATLDAETSSADADEVAALTEDAAALIMGAARAPQAPSVAGLERLLADVRRSPQEAAKAAARLDGSSWRSGARVVARVGELTAVSSRAGKARVTALLDPQTGLPLYARIESSRAP